MKTQAILLGIIASFAMSAQTRNIVATNHNPAANMRISNAQVQGLKNHVGGVGYRQSQQNITVSYDLVDEYAAIDSGGTYERFIWDLNTRYNPNDTSIFALTWAAVRFDTIYDFNTLVGYPRDTTHIMLDSVNVFVTHENITGTPDTIQISVYQWMGAMGIQVDAQEEIVNPAIFDTLIITTTSITPGATQLGVITVYPGLQLSYPDNRYIVGVHFYGDTSNTFTLLAGYADMCGGSCYARPSVFNLNSLWRMIAWAGQTNITGINGIAYDCNGNSNTGEAAACEEFPIQNLGIESYLTIDALPPCLSISLSAQPTNTTTCGACDGSIQLLPTGGIAPYTFIWSTGDTTANSLLTNLCAGTYSFTVIDTNNCSATGLVAVNSDSSGLAISTIATPIDCNNPLGTITVTVSDGTPPYIYNWFDGATDTSANASLSHDYDSAGLMIISVTDSLNCFQSVYELVVVLQPEIALVQSVRPVCTTDNGELKITVNSGVPPFSFAWSNGATTDSIGNLTAGTYSVTITDSSGCVDADTFTLAQSNGGSGFYVFMNSTPPNCGNTGAIITTIYGGTPPHTYSWNTGDTTQSLNNLGAGNYAITVTDSNGCQRTGAKTLQSTCSNIITGLIFEDLDGDCIADAGEPRIQNVTVTAFNGNQSFYGFTNASGEFAVFASDTGTFSLSPLTWSGIGCELFSVCEKIDPIYFPALGDTSIDNYFTYTSFSGHDLSVHPGWNQANPGFQKHYWILYSNEVQTPYTGQADISFVYDSALVYLYSTPPPDVHDTASRALTWYVNNVPQYISFSTAIDIYFQVPVNISGSHLIESHFYIEPSEGDCDQSDNYFFTEQPVVGSMDPNEKEVSPAGDIIPTDSILTYTIHFQNTGNDTTHFIILKDTLSPYVNPATVQTRASSHPYSEFSVSENGVLTWFFNPIHLVDSMTNEEESKGFIAFTVKKRNNTAIGTVIENKAGIYFDYNAPIITNTVQSMLSEPDWIFEPSEKNQVVVRAVPNPFSDATRITVDGVAGKFGFYLYDVFGKEQRKILATETNFFDLKRNGLSAGMYFYRIIASGKTVASGKLMVAQ